MLAIGTAIYEILEIDPRGNFIKLIESQKAYIKPLGIGHKVSQIEVTLISGETMTIEAFQEPNKYLLLDFWGTWCKDCTLDLPNLIKLKKKHESKLQVIGFNQGDNVTAIQKYNAKHEVNWTTAFATKELMNQLRIYIFPNYMLLDPNGKILLINATVEEIDGKI